jgi:cystathionine beta-lyase
MYDFDSMPLRRGSSSFKWDLNESSDLIAMSVADSDFVAPPFIRAALVECAHRPVFGYTFWSANARQLTAEWLERRHGWRPPHDAVLNCSGVLTGLRAALRALLQPGDAVVINTPAYPPFFDLPRANGYQVYESQLTSDQRHYGIDFDDLEKQLAKPAAKVMILCNPHNPVGRVFTRDELERVTELCLRHGVKVVSDEIHSDIVRHSQKHIPIGSLTPEAASNTITLVSPSKTFNIAGLATAAVICETPDLLRRIEHELKSIGNYHPDPFAIAAYEATFRDGHDYVTTMNAYLDANLRYACDFIAQSCKPLSARCPEGTYLIWIDCSDLGLTDDELRDFFTHEARVVLQSGRLFGTAGAGFMRLNAACPRSVLDTALGRIAAAVGSPLRRYANA